MAVPAVGVRVLAAFLLGACLPGCLSGACHLVRYTAEGGASVGFDLSQVLANVPGDVRVWACVEQKCVRHIGSSNRRATFWVNHAAFTDPETVDVRVVVRDHGRVVFDATRLVQLDESQPNGPGCDPTLFNAGVQATPEGDLIQQ